MTAAHSTLDAPCATPGLPGRSRPAARGALWLWMAALLWHFGLPWYGDAPLLLLIALLCRRAAIGRLALLAASMTAAAGIAEAGVRLLRHAKIVPDAIYRPEDKYPGESRFTPNIDTPFDIPFGDLPAMDPQIADLIARPRHVRFRTDSLGFRNDAEYHDPPWILLGDSLVAGSGSDQADMLGPVLRRDFGIESYSIAYPGEPENYFMRITAFAERFPLRPRSVFLFIFEGNDFICPERTPPLPGAYDRAKLRYIHAVEGLMSSPQYLFNLWRRLERIAGDATGARVEVYRVGDANLGFFGNYVDAARQPELVLKPAPLEPQGMPLLAAVYFVPVSFRVYYEWLPPARRGDLPRPPPGLTSTRERYERFGVPVIDLTPRMIARAHELLPRGEYVYWPDDTHWNGAGMRVAAEAVAEFIRAHPASQPAPPR